MITKRNLLVLLLGCVLIAPVSAQKFSKKDKARQEARAKDYFYGASFTVTAGYLHSWMLDGDVEVFTTDAFGRSECFMNTHDAFDIGFLWDQSFDRHWGMQQGLYYVQKGGEKHYYYNAGLGAGPILRDTKTISVSGIEWQALCRYYIPLTQVSRLSVNAGGYLTTLLNCHSNGIRNWDMGLMCGVGYDYRHLAVSVSYQPGVFYKVAKNSDLRLNALMVNVGFRFWGK